MLSLDRLRVLQAVSDSGSVRGAAETLHVTTSAVSQQLARLQREVGQPLLERHGRGVRLTDAADLLVEHASDLLARVEQAEADLAEHRGAVAGTLAVAAFATAARGLLPGALRTVRGRHPDLTVRLSESEPDDAIPLLLRGRLDVAVLQDWSESPLALPTGLTRQRLLDDLLDVALPADHPLAGRATVALTELADADWISWAPGQICHDWLSHTLRGNDIEPRIAHTAAEHSTQLALVAAGLGAAVIPRLGREPVPAGVAFVAIRPTASRRVFAVWRAAAARRPAIRAVVRALRDAADSSGNRQAGDPETG